MIDANWLRICKLALISGGASLCGAGASFLLRGHLREIAAGVASGLAFAAVALLVGALRRRGPLDTSPAAAARKARRARMAVVIGTPLGTVALVFIRLLHAEWFAAGLGLGIFAVFSLVVSPLFWTRSSRLADTSPRSRMTSVERGVGVRYE